MFLLQAGGTPLHYASLKGSATLVKLLLENGASVNFPNKVRKYVIFLQERAKRVENKPCSI